MKALLSEEEVGHLALSDNGRPYVIPINYAYMEDQIVLHCAVKGKKLDIIRQNPQCAIAVNRHPDKVHYHAEGKCHYRYHSVIVYGRAQYIESAEERLEWIKKYRAYFNKRLGGRMAEDDTIKDAGRCGIIVISIDEMTGKKEDSEPEEHKKE